MAKLALIVDDEQDICELLKRVLLREGLKVKYALSFEEAHHHLSTCIPDVVLLDLNLPDGNGFDLVPLLKKRNKNINIVIQSAHDGEYEINKAKELGVRFLSKPVEIGTIKKLLHQLDNCS